jgi:lactoylglutathione lyase
MKFINVRLLVTDISASINFWRDIMQLHVTYADESIGYAYFETDSSGVELMTRASFAAALGEAAPTASPAGYAAVLVFRVDDVDAAYADLVARGATSVAGPKDWSSVGVRNAHLSDPDGYLVELYNQLPGEKS